MSASLIDPCTPHDPPPDLRAHPRPHGSDVFTSLCPAVFVRTPTPLVVPPRYTMTDPVAQTRRCSICGDARPIASYTRDRSDGFGRGTICRSCQGEVNRENRQRLKRGEPLAGVYAVVRGRVAARRAAERERG